MKHLLFTLLFATLCATGYGQTIKALGYNTTNNRVVGPTNTNALVFTNAANFDGGAVFGGDVFINSFAISFGGTERINLEEARFLGEWAFDEPGAWRGNLGLGATWLTNDNVTNFRTAIGLGAQDSVTFDEVLATSADIAQITGNQIILFGTNGLSFDGTNAPAARVSTMRALAGSTNTNQPHSGNLDVVGQLGNFTIVVSNGIIIDVTQ